MGQTGFCQNLRFPAVFCENLRFPAVFCEDLRLRNASYIYIYNSREKRKSAKISENLRKKRRIWLRLFLWVWFVLSFPLTRGAGARCRTTPLAWRIITQDNYTLEKRGKAATADANKPISDRMPANLSQRRKNLGVKCPGPFLAPNLLH